MTNPDLTKGQDLTSLYIPEGCMDVRPRQIFDLLLYPFESVRSDVMRSKSEICYRFVTERVLLFAFFSHCIF